MRGSSPRMTMWGRDRVRRGRWFNRFPQAPGAGLIISLSRRALAPLAWLRATRAAQSRRPGLRPGNPGPWCGARGGQVRQHRGMKNRKPTEQNRRALLCRPPAGHTARGRRCGHRGRRNHRRDHRTHSGGGRGLLALGRRPLLQGRARVDPPAAGDRPHHQGLGAGARRPAGGGTGLFLIETLRTMTLATMPRSTGGTSPRPCRTSPASPHPPPHREHREAVQGPRARGGEGKSGGGQGDENGGEGQARRRGQAPGQSPAGDRRRHPRGGAGQAARASANGNICAGGPVGSRRLPRCPV